MFKNSVSPILKTLYKFPVQLPVFASRNKGIAIRAFTSKVKKTSSDQDFAVPSVDEEEDMLNNLMGNVKVKSAAEDGIAVEDVILKHPELLKDAPAPLRKAVEQTLAARKLKSGDKNPESS
ncbi:Schizosaccharomyces specific protein Mug143 [Schizosaccharomyces osmophilus]|uniref:Schizosaccharomyces specific protein Mug143 n=1 Tax=Schizosaccharomyces osmophilus TaxID=2545709 RepID=A0AAF0AW96_9SCHI|nr:Schizosaccharomyces specific protein Mug143 [Schizosaccharomyces osmophilus]WBW72830.1 Schizosaccharomyces specific protein Mug143 [Schizosaccharomyces osmophilus]